MYMYTDCYWYDIGINRNTPDILVLFTAWKMKFLRHIKDDLSLLYDRDDENP